MIGFPGNRSVVAIEFKMLVQTGVPPGDPPFTPVYHAIVIGWGTVNIKLHRAADESFSIYMIE
jgi:hypothetical protein